MAGLWVHNGEQWVPVTKVFRSTGTGWVPLDGIWRQMGANGEDEWLQIWERPNTPPPAPVLNVSLVTRTRNQFKVTLTTPDAVGNRRYLRAVVKVGINATPNPPTVNDGMYYSEKTDSEAWSEWFTQQTRDSFYIAENSSTTKLFPNEFQRNVTIPLNTNVTFSAWVQDEYGNWSEAATTTVKTRAASELPYGAVAYTTVIYPGDSDAWTTSEDNWLSNGRIIKGKRVYPGLDWTRDKANPRWWYFQGGSGRWITYLFFGNRLRTVLNAAAEVTAVKMTMYRRYNTSVNKSGGKIVNDANTFGPKTGVIFKVWAHNQSTQPDLGSTTHLITGSNSDIKTTGFNPGQTTSITIPKTTWQHLLDGKGNQAKGIAFYAAGTNGTATDKYSISFGIPSWSHFKSPKLNKDKMDGYVVVEWVGYDGNPWPRATPGAPNFLPVGITDENWS